MRDLIVNLLGEYSPTLSPDGDLVGGLYSLDFTWIVGAVCFVVLLLGFVSLLRILLKGLIGD